MLCVLTRLLYSYKKKMSIIIFGSHGFIPNNEPHRVISNIV